MASNSGQKTVTHQAWADRLRNWATFLVIIIHVSAPVAQEVTEYNSSFWWAGNVWDALARPAVPLFVMLSGFLLLSKDYPVVSFLKKRFSRVVVPSLFWMLVYSFYNHIANGAPETWSDALKGLISGPVHYHLWFIYLIIGLYLTYPIIRPWVRGAAGVDYAYFFVVCLIGTWVYKILLWFFDVAIGIYFELFTNHVGYFVLGYFLGREDLSGDFLKRFGPRWRFSWGLIFTGTAITSVGTWWASQAYGNTFHCFFYDYLTPGVTLSTAGWFLLARYYWNKPPLFEIESALAAASFGMYFVHVLVMDWWSEVGYWQSKGHPAKWVLAVSILVYVMSFVFIALLRAFRWGRKIS